MLYAAVVQDVKTALILCVFHAETKDAVLSLAKSSLTLTYQRAGEVSQVDGKGAIDSGMWTTPFGRRVTIRTHISYNQITPM